MYANNFGHWGKKIADCATTGSGRNQAAAYVIVGDCLLG